MQKFNRSLKSEEVAIAYGTSSRRSHPLTTKAKPRELTLTHLRSMLKKLESDRHSTEAPFEVLCGTCKSERLRHLSSEGIRNP